MNGFPLPSISTESDPSLVTLSSYFVAVLLNGLHAGALLFVSFVDVRLFVTLANTVENWKKEGSDGKEKDHEEEQQSTSSAPDNAAKRRRKGRKGHEGITPRSNAANKRQGDSQEDKVEAAAEILRGVFPIWWPAGRDLMAPLGLLSMLAHLQVYYLLGGRGTGTARQGGGGNEGGKGENYVNGMRRVWLLNAGLIAFTIVWTLVAMGEDIQALRNTKEKNKSSRGGEARETDMEERENEGSSNAVEVFTMARSFCIRHHFRMVASITAFALSLGAVLMGSIRIR